MTHPFRDLAAFPTVAKSGTQYRCVQVAYQDTPLFYGASGSNRFDLNPHSAHGTCYAADTEHGALLETVFRDVEPTGQLGVAPVLPPAVADKYRMFTFDADWDEMADLTGNPAADTHTAFGVTDAIGADTNYESPQQWAQAFHANALSGIRYRLRHSNGLLGSARFHAAGGYPAEGEFDELTAANIEAWYGGIVGAPALNELAVEEL
ncbi:MAG TPA: RES family NAD+ phosphorylase [Ilumatobacter sp.]|nr:RES family NAD+ phosphorylase [Ilumatobacter sp.]